MKATSTPIRELPSDKFQCARCGIIRTTRRNRPSIVCVDCADVEAAIASGRDWWTDEECRLAANAVKRGVRDPETLARRMEYDRRRLAAAGRGTR